MSSPTLGAVGLGANIAGGIFGAFGAHAQGEAQAATYNYQAGVAEINSKIALQNADYSRQQGENNALNYGMKAGQQLAGQKVALASSGLNVNSGSAAEVQKSGAIIAHQGLDTIRSNAAKTAYDYTVQASGFENQATLDRAAAANASKAGDINAFSSILGTAGSVSSKWLGGQQLGLWGGAGSSSSTASHEADFAAFGV